jgi:hypothetical protein
MKWNNWEIPENVECDDDEDPGRRYPFVVVPFIIICGDRTYSGLGTYRHG